MRRALAVVAAVAMVVLAVVVRSSLDDGTADRRVDGRVELLCVPELAEACEALGDDVVVTVEDPTVTLGALEAGELGGDVDGWLTTNAWLEVAQSRAPEGLEGARAVASTGTVVLVDDDRAAAVVARCGSAPVWRCLGDDAGVPWADLGGDPRWGALKTGVPDATTGTGLGVLVAVAAGYFGTTDFAANDFDLDDFRSWLTQLVGPRSGVVEDPLAVLATRPGAYTAAGGTTAQARSLAGGVTDLDATPAVTVQAVLVPFTGRDAVPATGPAVDLLRGAGWDEPLADLPRLLKPGVLAALLTLWTEVVR